MMKKETWVLLSLASVLLVFCAVCAVWGPAASGGAQRAAVCQELVQPDEDETSTGANNNIATANELRVRRLETARDAQRMKQQEAAHELQRRQQEATRTLS